MKIFTIAHSEGGYDTFDAFVIVANTKREVREKAKLCAADEGTLVWETAKITTEGIYTGKEKSPFVLLGSFNAG